MYSEASHMHRSGVFFKHFKETRGHATVLQGANPVSISWKKKPSHKHLYQDIYIGSCFSGQVVFQVNFKVLKVVLQNYLGLQSLSHALAPVQVGSRSPEPLWGWMSPKLTRRRLISAG